MAGSAKRNVRQRHERLVREAILRGVEEGKDPVEYMIEYARKLRKMALEGSEDSAVTLGALKEVFDRVDGKAEQEVVGEGLVAPTLLIEILESPRLKEKLVEGYVIEKDE